MAQIRFLKGNLAALCDARDLDLAPNDKVMVEWEDALKMGSVTDVKEIETGDSLPKHYARVIRKATEADLDYESRKDPKEREVYRACSARISEAGLPMNLVDVEYIPASNKFICSFTADGRVDFRNLVKTLASDFHARVEMKQIGARNRSKLIGGIGRCGRILCCASFLQDFDPITVRMAKDQGLSLDPTKISGVCGRLMCCLSYEHGTYCDYKKCLPKCGKKVTMECGSGKITKQDILTQRIWVKLDAGGKEVEVSLEDMKKEGLLKPAKKK
jgi:cell fate regulator YaaT (PSP1 superfamily)